MGTVGTGKTSGAGAVTTVGGGRGRVTRGRVLARRANGRGAPPGPKPKSTAGCTVPEAAAVFRRVRVEMRPEGDNSIGGAGLPGGEEADVARPVVAAESTPCEVLVGEGACSAAFAL
ncbi:unnamed protein product, partial [Laminaria digitata]